MYANRAWVLLVGALFGVVAVACGPSTTPPPAPQTVLELTYRVEVGLATEARRERDVEDLCEAYGESVARPGDALADGRPVLWLHREGATDPAGAEDELRRRGYAPEAAPTGEVAAWAMTPERVAEVAAAALEQATAVVRDRLESVGASASVRAEPDHTLVVELDARAAAKGTAIVAPVARLSFHHVDEGWTDARVRALERDAAAGLGVDEPSLVAVEAWAHADGRLPESRVLRGPPAMKGGLPSAGGPLVLHRVPFVRGEHVKDATVATDPFGGAYVALELDEDGRQRFAGASTRAVGSRIAIVLDDGVLMAPVVREPITGGRASLVLGTLPADELVAQSVQLAVALRSGALPAPLVLESQRVLGP